jgi:hypothetical protein
VVRDGVDDHSHSALLRLVGELAKPVDTTDFGIELAMVRDVIAMIATSARLGEWRSVTVADAEQMQIIDYASSLNQREFAVELQPVGGRWNATLGSQD